LLVAVYRFFTSEGLRIWIKWLCSWAISDGIRFPESQHIGKIVLWARSWSAGSDDLDVESQAAIQWLGAVVRDTSVLGEAIGKAAGAVWLHEKDDAWTVLNCFLLALKHYWKRVSRSRSNLEELQDLVASKFLGISDSEWVAGNEHQTPIVEGNIGLAFFSFLRWDECIRHWKLEGEYGGEDWDGLYDDHLAYAFLYERDYDGAIAVMEKRCGASYSGVLLQAYIAKGDYDGPLMSLQARLDRQPSWECLESLCSAHMARGDYDSAIRLLVIDMESHSFCMEKKGGLHRCNRRAPNGCG
jgi:tetratricopeptide (TPR) repeat protein